MKLLFLMSDLYFGGAETQMRYMLTALNEDTSIETTIVFENLDQKKKYTNLIGNFFKTNSRLHYINLDINRTNSYLKLIQLYYFFIKHTRKQHYNVFFSYSSMGLMSLPIIRHKNIKSIYSERNSGDTITARNIYIKLLRKVDNITCNSENAKLIIEKATQKSVEYIKNGISIMDPEALVNNTNQYDLQQPKVNKWQKLLLPARIHPDKNQLLIIELLKVNKQYTCAFAGPIADITYKDKVNNKVELYSLHEKALFLGNVTNIIELYHANDLVILPSFYEGTPNVVLESFANKIPVIASNIVMNNHLFEDKNLLFDPQDVDSLASSINYIKKMDISGYEDMLKHNYEFVKTNYNINVMTSTYISMMKNLL